MGHRVLFTYSGWKLWFQFDTNSPETTTFDPVVQVYDNIELLKWVLGDGNTIISNDFAHTYDDGTTKTVKVYRKKAEGLRNLNFNADHIVGTLNLPVLKSDIFISVVLYNNPELTSVTFNSFVGGVATIWIYNCNITGALDLSGISQTVTGNTEFSLFNNPLLTNLVLPLSVTGNLRVFAVENTGLSGVLDLSCFPEIKNSGSSYPSIRFYNTTIDEVIFNEFLDCANFRVLYGYNADLTGIVDLSMIDSWNAADIRLQTNPNMTGVTFSDDIGFVGDLRYLFLNSCDLTGTIDLTIWETLFSTGADIRLSSNPNLTGVTFASSIAGKLQNLYISSSGLSGTLNISAFENIHATLTDIRLNNNSSLTGVTFASSITGTLSVLYLYSCNITGTLDISMFTVLTANAQIQIQSNGNMTGVSMPTGTGSLRLFDANACDLGYIDFTGIPDALKINSSAIRIHDNRMTATEVNHILMDLAGLVSGEDAGGDFTGRTIRIDGTNAAPDTTSGGYNGVTAKSDLESKGITVTVTT
jgi:hypothetical protein